MISVVIPFYNRADYLARTLRSVAGQTVAPDEVVLVDNGSTDSSRQVCLDFIHSLPATTPIAFSLIDSPERGAAHARNCGWRAAKGDYIVFFDSDDEMSADFIADIRDYFSLHPSCQLVCAATRMVFGDGRERVRRGRRSRSVTDQILLGMLNTVGMAMSRQLLDSVGGWDDTLRIWDDWELGIRLLLARPETGWLRNKIYHRLYVHDESLTGSNFHSRSVALIATLRAARTVIEQQLPASRRRRHALAGIAIRHHFLAGMMEREGHLQEAKQMVEACRSLPVWPKWVYGLLRRYTAAGGRGTLSVGRFALKMTIW